MALTRLQSLWQCCMILESSGNFVLVDVGKVVMQIENESAQSNLVCAAYMPSLTVQLAKTNVIEVARHYGKKTCGYCHTQSTSLHVNLVCATSVVRVLFDLCSTHFSDRRRQSSDSPIK